MATERSKMGYWQGKCSSCSGEENVKHILLDCKDTKNWRLKLIHDKLLNMNKDVTYRKLVNDTNKAKIKNLRKYLDILKNKWLSKIKEL